MALTEEDRRNGQEIVQEWLSAPWSDGTKAELQRWLLEFGAALFSAAERGEIK